MAGYEVLVVSRAPQPSGPPVLTTVDPIAWRTLTLVDELSAPQQLTVECLASGLLESVAARLADPTWPSELWCYRDGQLVFAGPYRALRVDGERVTVVARGLLDYLRHMIVVADLAYTQVDQLTIAAGLVDQWQALEHGHFGIDTSTVGTSGVLRDATYERDELHPVYQRVYELARRRNGFDIAVDPLSRKLLLSHPQQGTDRSTGDDAVVFDGRNVTSPNVVISAGPDDVASDGYGTGTTSDGTGTTLYSTQADTELRARYGRSAVTGTWDSVTQQSTLDEHVLGLVDARSAGLVVPGPDARNVPDADLAAFAVGDTVAYRVSQALPIAGPFRVRARTVRVAGTGQESISLEFA